MPEDTNASGMLPSTQLHDYQELAKNFVKSTPKCGLFLPMGLGKAVDDDTIMPTPDGMRRLGDLLVGDNVFDVLGNPCKITAVYKHPGKSANRVTLDDGRQFNCCDEHLIPIVRYEGDTLGAPTMLKDLMGDFVTQEPGEKPKFKYAIPRNYAVDYPKKVHVISAKTLGTILAHGQLVNGRLGFVVDDDSTWQRTFETRICPMVQESDGLFYFDDVSPKTVQFQGQIGCSQPIVDELYRLGYQDNTPFDFIPDDYHIDHIFNRRDLLMGLFDLSTDNMKTSIKFETKALTLAENTALVLRSMGFSASIAVKPRAKTAVLTTVLKNNMADWKSVTITDITPIGNLDMTCFTVNSATHTYLINDYIVTHNTLIVLQALFELNPNGHVLVVAPKNIARATWTAEIKKWQMPIRTVSLIVNEKQKDLSRKKRLELYSQILSTPPSVYFINRELLEDLIKHMPKTKDGRTIWPFPFVIIDELQSFKSYKASRFKALKAMFPAYTRFIGMTGTPTPKDLQDLWPEIYLMDGGARLGKTITEYRRRYFRETLRVNGYPVKWEPLPGAEDEIYRLISDIVISMKKENPLPPIYNSIRAYMDDDEMALYKQFARDSVLNIDDDNTVIAPNSAVLKNKLVQMASGTIYINPQKEYKIIHQKKLEICRYIIDNSDGNVLIAYHFQAERDQLLEYLPEAELFDGTPDMIDRWNNKDIPVMLIQPASAGHGLNLQYGGHTLVWYTIHPNLEEYLQTNARLDRQGQTETVIIHHIIMDKTVDDGMLALLDRKELSEEQLMAAVRVALIEALS